ncbi:MAG: TIGR02710 family CRISPR-associated CARF protein [candidate division WOR-3 bacterium]
MEKKILVTTIGIGKTILSAIARSVYTHNPNRVVFVCTNESKEKHGEEINNIVGPEKDFFIVSDPSNADRLVLECARIIADEQKQGKVCVDFTTGTKAMSAALYAAALALDIETTSYVEGERDEGGIVISKTERVKTLMNTIPSAILSSKRAIELYNSCFYGSALEIAREIRDRIGKLKDMSAKAEALYLICELSYRWDSFEFAEAAKTLNIHDKSVLSAMGEMLGCAPDVIQDNIPRLIEYLEKLTESLNPSLAWELLRNAERRAKTGRFDDAVGRLYRAIEYIGQLKLHDLGLFDGENFKLDKSASLPEDLNEKLEKGLPLGLKDVFRYLWHLKKNDDSLANGVIENDELTTEFQVALAARNKSILAHGFSPVGKENYEKLRKLAEDLIKRAGIKEPDFNILNIKVRTLL